MCANSGTEPAAWWNSKVCALKLGLKDENLTFYQSLMEDVDAAEI